MESGREFVIVAILSCSSISASCVDTADHVVELRGGQDTWREGGSDWRKRGMRRGKMGKEQIKSQVKRAQSLKCDYLMQMPHCSYHNTFKRALHTHC